MISSIDLFLSRDCVGGDGPAVEVLKFVPAFATLFDVFVDVGGILGCVEADGSVGGARAPNKLDFVAGAPKIDCVPAADVAVGSFEELVVVIEGLVGPGKKLLEAPLVEVAVASGLFFFAPRAPNRLGAFEGAEEVNGKARLGFDELAEKAGGGAPNIGLPGPFVGPPGGAWLLEKNVEVSLVGAAWDCAPASLALCPLSKLVDSLLLGLLRWLNNPPPV